MDTGRELFIDLVTINQQQDRCDVVSSRMRPQKITLWQLTTAKADGYSRRVEGQLRVAVLLADYETMVLESGWCFLLGILWEEGAVVGLVHLFFADSTHMLLIALLPRLSEFLVHQKHFAGLAG